MIQVAELAMSSVLPALELPSEYLPSEDFASSATRRRKHAEEGVGVNPVAELAMSSVLPTLELPRTNTYAPKTLRLRLRDDASMLEKALP